MRCLLLARFHLRIKLGLLLRITPSRTRLDLRLGLPDRSQTYFAPRAFLRNARALRQRLLIGGLSSREQFLNLGFELRLDLLRLPVGERAMTRGIGVNLGTIQSNRTKLEQLHLTGDAQHLHKQHLDLFEKALAQGAQRVMIRLPLFYGRFSAWVTTGYLSTLATWAWRTSLGVRPSNLRRALSNGV